MLLVKIRGGGGEVCVTGCFKRDIRAGFMYRE